MQSSGGFKSSLGDLVTYAIPPPDFSKEPTPSEPLSAEPLSSYAPTLELSATRKALSLPETVETHLESTLVAYSPPAGVTAQDVVVVVNVKTVEVTTTTTVFSSTSTVLQWTFSWL